MRIGVCDDDEIIREEICNLCYRVSSKYAEDTEIISFADGCEALGSNSQPDILVLDIEMPVMNGIELKEKLQDSRKNTIIIFVTEHDEQMGEAFGINVIGFVGKKYLKTQLPVMLEAAIKMAGRSVLVDGIDSRNICYIRSEHVYSFFHMADGQEHMVRISSKELEKQLSSVDFIRIHRALLVNLAYVDRIGDRYVVVDGVDLPVSYRLNAQVKRKYDLYCKENARFC